MRSRSLAIAILIVLAGCGGTPPAAQVDTPAPSLPRVLPTASALAPTPTPTPTPSVTQEQLAAVCSGRAIPSAAPYAGMVHPLVVIDGWLGRYVDSVYVINKKLDNGTWQSSQIQLVVCVPFDQGASVNVGSCGRNWTRKGDGMTGELLLQRYRMKVRVVLARTGKTLQTEALFGSVPTCGGKFSLLDLSVKPPWKGYGSKVTRAQINTYATVVSNQPVK